MESLKQKLVLLRDEQEQELKLLKTFTPFEDYREQVVFTEGMILAYNKVISLIS